MRGDVTYLDLTMGPLSVTVSTGWMRDWSRSLWVAGGGVCGFRDKGRVPET